MDTFLEHYGVLGMKWGRRRGQKSISPDRQKYEAVRKKKISDMTNEEIKAVTKRLRLEKDYRDTPFVRQRSPKELSNEELDLGIKRNSLKKAYLKESPANLFDRKLKDVDKMDLAAVDKILTRMTLEKEMKDLAEADIRAASELVFGFLKGQQDEKGKKK